MCFNSLFDVNHFNGPGDRITSHPPLSPSSPPHLRLIQCLRSAVEYIISLIFSSLNSPFLTTGIRRRHTFRPDGVSPQTPPPTADTVLVGCCVFFFVCWPLRPRSVLVSSFYLSLNLTADTMRQRHPHTFHLIRVFSRKPPRPRTTILCWLLHVTNEQRRPHNGETPSSIRFDGSCLSAQNKGKESGENEPAPPGACIGLMGSCGAMI